MRINLLPRKPAINQWYIPIMIAMIVLFVGSALVLFFYSFSTNVNMEADKNKIKQLNTRIRTLNALHQVDPKTKDYEAFLAQINQVKSESRDWVPVFQLISTNLFKTSRLLNMDATDKEILTLHLEFAFLQEVANYAILLKRSPLLDKVSIKEISQAQRSKVVTSAENTIKNLPANERLPLSNLPDEGKKIVTVEELMKSLEVGAKDSSFQGDQLLQQLQDIVNKQSVKQQFGIDVPVKKPAVKPIDSSLKASPFSQKEIDDATKSLNNFKQNKVADQPTGNTNPTAIQPAPTKAPEVEKPLLYYDVTIELQLKPLVQGK